MTGGLQLREFRPGDAWLLAVLAEDPEVHYFDGDAIAGGWSQTAGEQLVWVPELHGEVQIQPIGVVGCRLVNGNPKVYTLGINLLAECRGLGLGKLVMRQVLRRLFGELMADRVELLVRDYNHRAICCYRAVGFRQEGLRRHCGQQAGLIYGEMLMGILREEYLGHAAGDR
ncbi:MAG: GNAT family N-acetyltransferase [Bacillota bacterium]